MSLRPLSNRNFNNTNTDELVMHVGASFQDANFFKTVAVDREFGIVMIGYSDSTDYFVVSPNHNDTTGPHFPVKTNGAKQKLLQMVNRNMDYWINSAGALDLKAELPVVGTRNDNTLIVRYGEVYVFATFTSPTEIVFDKETLIAVNPFVLNILSKYLQIPGVVQAIVSRLGSNKRSNLSVNRMDIKGLYNNNNRTQLALRYKNQPLAYDTKNQKITIPRNSTLSLSNLDRIVLEKYVKEHYVYNPNTRRVVDSSVKSFKPVKSVPDLLPQELNLLSEFNRKHNGKRLIVSQNATMFNGGSGSNNNNNNTNDIIALKNTVSKVIDSAIPVGTDRRTYWNGNYNVIFRNNVSRDYTLYQDWHRDIDKQYNQSMYAFVIFFINGDDRYDGGELVCIRPRANQTVNKANLVTCNPAASTGQAVVLHAGTGYHTVTPYINKLNMNNNNGLVKRNMLLIQLFTDRYMLDEQNLPVGSVKQYANNQMKQKLNKVLN